MVRTKTKPRTHTGGKAPPEPWKARVPVPNNVIFSDHTGKPALMSWTSYEEGNNLPPLSSWVFYMVHPDVTPDFDGVKFQQELDDGENMHRDSNFRFEFFFLPDATVEECHAHYLGEMKARGTIWRQIRKLKKIMVPRREQMKKEIRELEGREWDEELDWTEKAYEDETDDDEDAGEQLPGLVWPKYETEYELHSVGYRGWFFIYPDADLSLKGEAGLNRDIYLVQFDPVPLIEGETYIFKPTDHPLHAEKMKARVPGYDGGIWGWIYNRMKSVWEQEADQATDDAVELGWKSW